MNPDDVVKMETSISSSGATSTTLDDDFAPEPRDRCYTWPMQAYSNAYDTPELLSPMPRPIGSTPHHLQPTLGQLLSASPSSSTTTTPPSAMSSHLMPLGFANNPYFSPTLGTNQNGPSNSAQPQAPPKKKRSRKKPADQLAQKKPNPWGEDSYSDIIAKALESAPNGRLKLNEIYQWFSDNIPYFRDRSSQEEAAGWKVGDFCRRFGRNFSIFPIPKCCFPIVLYHCANLSCRFNTMPKFF